eukprot:gene2038-2508_t
MISFLSRSTSPSSSSLPLAASTLSKFKLIQLRNLNSINFNNSFIIENYNNNNSKSFYSTSRFNHKNSNKSNRFKKNFTETDDDAINISKDKSTKPQTSKPYRTKRNDTINIGENIDQNIPNNKSKRSQKNNSENILSTTHLNNKRDIPTTPPTPPIPPIPPTPPKSTISKGTKRTDTINISEDIVKNIFPNSKSKKSKKNIIENISTTADDNVVNKSQSKPPTNSTPTPTPITTTTTKTTTSSSSTINISEDLPNYKSKKSKKKNITESKSTTDDEVVNTRQSKPPTNSTTTTATTTSSSLSTSTDSINISEDLPTNKSKKSKKKNITESKSTTDDVVKNSQSKPPINSTPQFTKPTTPTISIEDRIDNNSMNVIDSEPSLPKSVKIGKIPSTSYRSINSSTDIDTADDDKDDDYDDEKISNSYLNSYLNTFIKYKFDVSSLKDNSNIWLSSQARLLKLHHLRLDRIDKRRMELGKDLEPKGTEFDPESTNFSNPLLKNLKHFDQHCNPKKIGPQVIRSNQFPPFSSQSYFKNLSFIPDQPNNNDNNSNSKKNTIKQNQKNLIQLFTNYFNPSFNQNMERIDSTVSWVQQYLPNCKEIQGDYGSTHHHLGEMCFNYIYPILFFLQSQYDQVGIKNGGGKNFSFLIHCFPEEIDENGDHAAQVRANRIKRVIINSIKDSRKRLFNAMVESPTYNLFKNERKFKDDQSDNTLENNIFLQANQQLVEFSKKGLYVVQILLSPKDKMYISISKSNYSDKTGWSLPFPFEKGMFPHLETSVPPSRAYKKLYEIFSMLGRVPQKKEICVDLGSAPGGWTRPLLDLYQDPQDKLTVFSVDRAPLDDSVILKYKTSPNLIHNIGNGVTWRPPIDKKVDWLFNDMAMPPLLSFRVLEDWIKEQLCTNFVWTLKFVGREEHHPAFIKIQTALKKYPNVKYVIRHLNSQGNELVILGTIDKTN